MSSIYSADSLRKWDTYTIDNEKISSLDLMERAATLCTKHIVGSYYFETALIICGLGNNGGDGLVIARLLALRNIQVTVAICHYSNHQSPDFKTNLDRLPKNIKVNHLGDQSTLEIEHDLIIDCLFGTGLNRPIKGWLAKIIQQANTSGRPIVSIDMPSGLMVEQNDLYEDITAIYAHRTLTFQVPKIPFFFSKYNDFVGRFSILDIQLNSNFKATALAEYVEKRTISIKRRATFTHKGHYGYLTIVGGNEQMLGSALLAAHGGLKSGAGYVGVISTPQILSPLATRLPEAIYNGSKIESMSPKTTAIGIGPGLGKSDSSFTKLKAVLQSNVPLVIDADAITLLAEHTTLLNELPENTILT